MAQPDPIPENQGKSKPHIPIDLLATGEEVLERAREIARKAVEGLRTLDVDTKTDTPPQGTAMDPTDEMPPIA